MKKDIITEKDLEGKLEYKSVKGWVDHNNFFYGKDKQRAIYKNITHKHCDCGNLVEKHYTRCSTCSSRLKIEKYNSMPFMEYDGVSAVYCDYLEQYFVDIGELEDLIEEDQEEGEGLLKENLRLIICRKEKIPTISEEYFDDYLPEDFELKDYDKEISESLDKLNKLIETKESNVWQTGKFRTSI